MSFLLLGTMYGCSRGEPLPVSVQQVIEKSGAVRVYRTGFGLDENSQPVPGLKRVGQYAIFEERSLPPEASQDLARLLADPRFYDTPDPDEQLTCIFDPGWVVVFQSESAEAKVFLCYKCREVEVSASPHLGWAGLQKSMGSAELSRRVHDILSNYLPQPAA